MLISELAHIHERVNSPVLHRPLAATELPEAVSLNNYGMFVANDNPPDHAPPPLTVEEMVAGYNNGHFIDGAFSNGRLIGLSWTIPRNQELYVNVLAVHPDFRDQGIGTAFLQQADRQALGRGLTSLSLAVDPWNGRGVNAYLKHGYKITDFKESYYGEDYPNSQRFKMVKSLTPTYYEVQGLNRLIKVNDPDTMSRALSEGFVGTHLLRNFQGDNRENVIVFIK